MDPTHHLWPLLAPRTIALMGASDRVGSLGRIVCENLLAGGFRGPIYLVNARHNDVQGRKAYRSLRAIDRPVDLAVICVPPEAVPEAIDQCRGRVRAAVVMSSTTASRPEAYLRWRRKLAARARAAGIRMLGPGSFGIMRPVIGLDATSGTAKAVSGRLALITQSGAIAGALLDFAHAAGVGFSSVVTLGAAADVDFGEVLEFALADAQTDSIVLYVERIRDARAFVSALRAAARTKPVVVLKAGRSLTAPAPSPAIDPDRVFDAVLERAGTVRVRTYTQLFAAALMLGAGRIPRGNRMGIVTNGRGPGVVAADRAAEMNVALASLSPQSVAALQAWVPQKGAPAGLIDLENGSTPEQFAMALRTLIADRGVDAVLVMHVSVPAAPATDTARAVADAARGSDKPILAAWLGSIDRPEAHAALEAGGVVHFHTPENAVEAFSFLSSYRRNQEWLLQVPPPQPEPLLPNLAAALRVRDHAIAAGRSTLNLGETQVLLAAFGVSMPMAVVMRLDDAHVAARQLGFPVSVEFESDEGDAPSRTRLRTGVALADAFAELRRVRGRARRNEPVVVRKPLETLVPDSGTMTVRVAVHSDAVFGPVIALGDLRAPGSERALMLPPLNRALALELIRRGSRGRELVDEPLVALLLNVSALVCALPWLAELELSPVVTRRGTAWVVAARATIDGSRPAAMTGYRHMAIHPYPAELDSEITLRDGTMLRVRPIRPEDAELEQAFVTSLSQQTRYMRFMQHLPGLTPQMLARFTQVDYDRELALVALDEGDEETKGEHIVAVARYVAYPDGETVEFAIVVGDAWQHRGVGRLLLQRLIAVAAKRGYARMIGNVLTMNSPMLAFMRDMGFTVRRDPNDSDQMVVTLDLGAGRRRVTRATTSAR
ncbi:MAG TPA: GNAT family N-acetyltransferase [Casimicrobiaceae bacterium]|jgi:acetyltransferase